jgi:hypothetical protein
MAVDGGWTWKFDGAALGARRFSTGHFGKVAMGLSAIVVGAMILTGADRSVETTLVSTSPAWLTDLTTQF